MNNSPINSSINSTTIVELADVTSLNFTKMHILLKLKMDMREFSIALEIGPKISKLQKKKILPQKVCEPLF